jgi:hypothetical protein
MQVGLLSLSGWRKSVSENVVKLQRIVDRCRSEPKGVRGDQRGALSAPRADVRFGSKADIQLSGRCVGCRKSAMGGKRTSGEVC